jgi:sugar-specific transcriptional regulator TrmB
MRTWQVTRPFSVQPLVSLGLTALEAEVYAFLVENSPATGYRVAKRIGKPTANTYRAIQSLEVKGWIVVEDSRRRLCRAVPVEEALNALQQGFFDLQAKATRELAKLRPAPGDEHLYHLTTPGQVFERLRRMLKGCKEIVLLDIFPGPLEQLAGDIVSTAARNIKVAIKAYGPCNLPGTEIVLDTRPERTRGRWPGEWANCVVDGKEHLLALLSPDGTRVLQAIWSANTYTSWIFHSSLMHEMLYSALGGSLEGPQAPVDLPDNYRRLCALKAKTVAGYRLLVERFGEKEAKNET